MQRQLSKVLGLHYQIGQLLGISWPQGFWGIWQDGTDVGAPGDTEGSEVPFYKYGELNSESLGVFRGAGADTNVGSGV